MNSTKILLKDLPQTKNPIMFDIETDSTPTNKSSKGLYGKIVLAQFYAKEWGDAVYYVENPNPHELWAFIVSNTIVAHNITYELSCVQEQAGVSLTSDLNLFDTNILSKLVNPRLRSYTLDNVILGLTGKNPYEEAGIDKKKMQKSFRVGGVLSPQQIQYACFDVFYLQQVFDVCEDIKGHIWSRLHHKTIPHFISFQQNGIKVDPLAIATRLAENNVKFKALEVPEHLNVQCYRGKNNIAHYIGTATSDALTLAEAWFAGNEKARQVRDARRLLKNDSFCRSYQNNMDVNGRVHGYFGPNARTGRSSCSEVNLQQIPRNLRGLFISEPGKVLVYSDFSQLELRCFAAAIGEYKMAAIMKEGGDIHGYTAERVFGKGYTKEQRFIGKTMNFQLLYGCGINRLRATYLLDDIMISYDDVANYHAQWYDIWTGAFEYKKAGLEAIKMGQLWSTPLGMKYLGHTLNDQLNFKVQGFGAEVSALTICKLHKGITEDMKLCNFMHDSFLFEVPDDERIISQVSDLIATSMQEAWKEVSSNSIISDIPMPITVIVGTNWGDIESGKGRSEKVYA